MYKYNIKDKEKEEPMWSKELQKQTIEFFKTIPMAAMKNFDGAFGICILNDGIYTITDRKTYEEYVYESIDALLEAKWAID